MHIGLVAPSDAGLVWNIAKPFLELSVPYTGGRCTIQDMEDEIRAGRQYLWLVADQHRQPIAAFTTRIIDYPVMKMLVCQFCGGQRMDEWIELADEVLVNFARDAGCVAIEMTGRPGWQRKLPSSWETEATLYRREIPNAPLPQDQEDPPP